MYYLFIDYLEDEFSLFNNKDTIKQFEIDFCKRWTEHNYEPQSEIDYRILPIYNINPALWEVYGDD